MRSSIRVKHLVKALRSKSGLNQQKFADKYKMTRERISAYENGRGFPKGDVLLEMIRDECPGSYAVILITLGLDHA